MFQKIHSYSRNDNINFKSIMKKIKYEFVVDDNSYDSKSNKYFVLRNMCAYPHILERKFLRITYKDILY